MENIGSCRYCGQTAILDVEVATKDTADEEATLKCNCDGAKNYKYKLERIKKANDNIELAFHESYHDTEYLLKAAVPALIDYKIAKMTVDTGAGTKGEIKLTNKGNIKVSKSISKKVEYDE